MPRTVVCMMKIKNFGNLKKMIEIPVTKHPVSVQTVLRDGVLTIRNMIQILYNIMIVGETLETFHSIDVEF